MEADNAFEAVNGDAKVCGFGHLLDGKIISNTSSPIPDEFMNVCQCLWSSNDLVQEVVEGSL